MVPAQVIFAHQLKSVTTERRNVYSRSVVLIMLPVSPLWSTHTQHLQTPNFRPDDQAHDEDDSDHHLL
jgi:hypothetical protein